MTRTSPTPYVQSSWTDERVARMTKLWNDGMSAAQVAKALGGTTRNAVIGKVNRLRLQPRSREAAAQSATFTNMSRERVYRRPVTVPLPPLREGPVGQPRHWTTRTFGECAYPVTGDGADLESCCNPCRTDGGWSYCEEHRKIMFATVRTPAQRAADEARRKRNHERRRAA